jgi:hypothetical protein
MLLLLTAIKQNKQTTNTTKNNTPSKRGASKESARIAENGAIVKETRLSRLAIKLEKQTMSLIHFS